MNTTPKIVQPSKSRRVYVPGTYTELPYRLRSYRDEYLAVGRNIFVQIPEKVTLAKLKDDKRSMATVANKYPGKTFGQIVMEIMGDRLRKATAVEIEDYRARKAKCDNFIREIKQDQAKRHAAWKTKKINDAKTMLERCGMSVTVTEKVKQD